MLPKLGASSSALSNVGLQSELWPGSQLQSTFKDENCRDWEKSEKLLPPFCQVLFCSGELEWEKHKNTLEGIGSHHLKNKTA